MSMCKSLCLTLLAVLMLVAVGAFEAGASSSSTEESDLAAPGAALYEYAVTESVKSLMSKEEQVEARPPSPGPDYFWCENCKTYHKKQAPGSAGQPAVSPTPGAAPGQPLQPNAATAARPPSPGPNYYWCEQCKSYHLRQAATNQPAAAVQASPGTLVPLGTPAAGPGTNPPPASPGEGYYWCEQCKSYHPRTALAQQPGTVPSAPLTPAQAAGTVAAQTPGADYYYCEQCKTYHRRQPVAQQPAEKVSSIFGGVSNNPVANPLIGPAGPGR